MWKELIEQLYELEKTYRALIALSERKHQALVVLDMKALEQMNAEEAKLAQQIRKLEQARQKALIDLSVEYRGITKETRMKELIRLAPGPQHRQILSKLYQALDASTKRAAELRDQNRFLTESALRAVKYHLNRLGGAKTDGAYGAGGAESGKAPRSFEIKA